MSQPLSRLAGRPGLDRDERVMQQSLGDPLGVGGTLGEFNTPLTRAGHLPLAAATGVDLGLDSADGRAESGISRSGVLWGLGNLTGQDGHTGGPEEILGLKLVNLHQGPRGGAVAGTAESRDRSPKYCRKPTRRNPPRFCPRGADVQSAKWGRR